MTYISIQIVYFLSLVSDFFPFYSFFIYEVSTNFRIFVNMKPLQRVEKLSVNTVIDGRAYG